MSCESPADHHLIPHYIHILNRFCCVKTVINILRFVASLVNTDSKKCFIFVYAVDVHCCPAMQCTNKIGEMLTAAKN